MSGSYFGLNARLSASIFAILFGFNVGAAHAGNLNAGFVLNEMSSKQRSGYIAGVIEGLAYARFLRDKPNESGMKCIYDWYYVDGSKAATRKRVNGILKWLGLHPKLPVGALINVLLEEKCGE